MERVTLYLRTPLFSLGTASAHLPTGVTVVEGKVLDQASGGLIVEVSRMLSGERVLSEAPIRLLIPMSKVDHVHVLE
ncbi:MAG: hypothetical protein JXX28_16575 [Deltaproteobacteria bacterium]|nr:hypothetical protein [Deltaproteobacteria bacterium]